MLFAGVTTNAGGGYNSTTSIFTCPKTAFYYIYFHLYLIMDDGADETYCRMDIKQDAGRVAEVCTRHLHFRKKSVVHMFKAPLRNTFQPHLTTLNFARMYVYTDASNKHNNLFSQAGEYVYDGVRHEGMTSTSVVLECHAGSQVWVESRYYCHVSGNTVYQFSSFGGFMLQRL